MFTHPDQIEKRHIAIFIREHANFAADKVNRVARFKQDSIALQRTFQERNPDRVAQLRQLPDTGARMTHVFSLLIRGVQDQKEIFEAFWVYCMKQVISFRPIEGARRPVLPAAATRNINALPQSITAAGDMLRLQRAYGNRAVASLQRTPIQDGEIDPQVSDAINRSRGGGSALPIKSALAGQQRRGDCDRSADLRHRHA